jgi:hypothetical protein
VASTGDIKATTNGPGTISDALTAFEAQATKLPTGPAPDPNVAIAYAVAYALGWAAALSAPLTRCLVFSSALGIFTDRGMPAWRHSSARRGSERAGGWQRRS